MAKRRQRSGTRGTGGGGTATIEPPASQSDSQSGEQLGSSVDLGDGGSVNHPDNQPDNGPDNGPDNRTPAERIEHAAQALIDAIERSLAEAHASARAAAGDAERAGAVADAADGGTTSEIAAATDAVRDLLGSATDADRLVRDVHSAILRSRARVTGAISQGVPRAEGAQRTSGPAPRRVAALLSVLETPPSESRAANAAGELPGDGR